MCAGFGGGVCLGDRLRHFLNVYDSRFEDLKRGHLISILYRDFSAGLIVAMTAIPLAMGFAMASGLRPEQGIIAGAVACLVGRTFGGSKYQVYGPTAAFIPVIALIVSKYDHGFLVFVSLLAGIVLMILGLAGMGKVARLVPNGIVVGFTAGIATLIALTNAGDALGVTFVRQATFVDSIQGYWAALAGFNPYAVGLALMTFLLCRYLMRISVFIPAPLLAIALCTWITSAFLSDKGIVLVADEFGTIPHDFFAFTPPVLPALSLKVFGDVIYFVAAIVFVSGVESLLCSSMADRLAKNTGTPFNPDKEFWGQGLVQIATSLLNGFPCTGALARTATSIKAGAVTPMAGYFKGFLKLFIAYFIARYLEHIPMACIAGILVWVASNMLKFDEILAEAKSGPMNALLVVYTAIMVPATDFLTGVLSALAIYATFVMAGRLYPWRREEPA